VELISTTGVEKQADKAKQQTTRRNLESVARSLRSKQLVGGPY